jgi:hypothetical protein
MAASRSRSRRLASSAAAVGERAAAVGSTPPTARSKASQRLRNNRVSALAGTSEWCLVEVARTHRARRRAAALRARAASCAAARGPQAARYTRATPQSGQAFVAAPRRSAGEAAAFGRPPVRRRNEQAGWLVWHVIEARLVLLSTVGWSCGRGAVLCFAAATAVPRTSRSSSLRDCRSATSATWLLQRQVKSTMLRACRKRRRTAEAPGGARGLSPCARRSCEKASCARAPPA